MKYTPLVLLLCAVLFSSCAHYSQVVFVQSTSDNISKNKNGFLQYENEDLKISYSFWDSRGIMGFQIYNKTDHPIYIDWKKSSMISNEKQLPYYTNKTTSNFSTYGSSYSTNWVSMFSSGTQTNNTTTGSGTTIVQERITFIAPKSYISNAFYDLVANIYFDVNKTTTEEKDVKGTHVYYSKSNFDITFRNYLTYSDKEYFSIEKHVDNGFQIDKVYTMKDADFGEVFKGALVSSDWRNPSRFYIIGAQLSK